ncbi:hypothetical protein JCM10914A_12970 [Paenibacillus sp. JCM 10914]|nr:hypothetical protein JCM10914_5374 [Paenibacillus sp. JCM 10914]
MPETQIGLNASSPLLYREARQHIGLGDNRDGPSGISGIAKSTNQLKANSQKLQKFSFSYAKLAHFHKFLRLCIFFKRNGPIGAFSLEKDAF